MTAKDIKDRLRTIKLEAERLRAQLKRLEPKPKRPKVKVRRVVSAEERERARLYEAFREEHQTCWACGRDRKPPKWYEPWLPNERAHIVNKPRVEDIRCVVSLCTICHRISHWERFAHFKQPEKLTLENLLWLKREHDPDHFDLEFLQRHSVKRLPTPTPPGAWQ
jgi:hypothetical protein